MKRVHLFGSCMVMLAITMTVGCSNRGDSLKGGDKGKGSQKDEHEHGDGPHGGAVADWGGGKYHVEFCMDHDKKQATVYILDDDAKKAVPLKIDKLLLSIKEPSFQIDLTPLPLEGESKGMSSRFVGTHDNFAKKQEFAGTISGEVSGKPFAGDFKEKPEKESEKKK